jgi:hypothetical protein
MRMAVAASRWPGNRSMDVFERMRLVADAILLERAVGVLKRRGLDDVTQYRVATFLASRAVILRGVAEAEADVPVR